jgi:2-oxoglutarate dehydrogenase E2 component (dihydrolipoamide succinyltransferase)
MSMPIEIVVPDLGESIIEATVANWLKNEGDNVSVGEAIVELETDKVDLEVGAPQDGVLSRIEAQAGEDVKVGQVLGLIDAAGVGEESDSSPPEQAVSEKEPESGQPTVVAEAEESGGLESQTSEQPEKEEAGAERATPVARRLAGEHGIELSQLRSAAPGRRITREDVEQYIRSHGDGEQHESIAEEEPPTSTGQAEPTPVAEKTKTEAAPTPSAQDRDGERREERVRMTRRRRTIAQRLVEAQQTAAILTTFNDVNMTAVMELRRKRREAFEAKHGVKLGIMSFFVKATVSALKDFPLLNAEIQGDEIVLKHYYDIGIAIGAEEGLVVPVLRSADRMTFAEIERAINGFVQKSRDGSLSIEDLRGGTFSITNGGVYGSLLSTPILNPPQSGILGMHRIEERPVALNGQVVIRPVMYLALSYDHRIVDGREAVQFLVRVKELVEEPEAMLLEG